VTILVVEDEDRIASFIGKGLAAHGFQPETVGTGHGALERLQRGSVSVVILDLGLPDMDGLDILRALRQEGNGVPVIILSARGEVDDRVRGLEAGADDYLGKPFAFEELVARVEARLRSQAASPSA
jgi:DNA-binding response OmpR family regulator